MRPRSPEELEKAISKVREDIARLELKSAALEQLRPHPKPSFPASKSRLKVQDLTHPGAEVFFANTNLCTALSQAVNAVLSILYEPTKTNDHIPPTRSVTLVLRAMDGVAYTVGSDSDEDNKQIHFSLNYIHDVSRRPPQPGQPGAEIQGVLVHEMVHCWQWNGLGAAPGGLIEGIADFVRLKAGLSPSHWKREGGDKWDAGYQVTGYFLEWIESQMGEGSVRMINQALQGKKYEEENFWDDLFGKKVKDLWKEYLGNLEKETGINAKPEAHAEAQPDSLSEEDSCVRNEDSTPREGSA